HDVSGMSAFINDKKILLYLVGLVSSKLSDHVFDMINPTINLQVGDFKKFPVLIDNNEKVISLTEENINIAKKDWNSFETSWNFEESPLIKYKENTPLVEESYINWIKITDDNFMKLKANQEELNRIFIEVYG